ncbi:MAG: SGNH/GDSL hydrolase family protein [Sporichthyaceae bacterium]
MSRLLTGVVTGAALVVAPLTSTSTSYATAAPEYLALGDSVAYGYDPTIQGATTEHQFVGYPEELGAARGNRVVNATCPGDTAAGFVSATGKDIGCREFKAYYKILHVNYDGPQLEFATEFLRTHPTTELVTLQIGLNDVYECMSRTPDFCASDIHSVMAQYRTNLTTILQGLRAVYGGPIVLVSYHAQYYAIPSTTFAPLHMNLVMADVGPAFGAILADTYGTFAAAAGPFGGDTCAAGLLIVDSKGNCDAHLSPAGRSLAATTIAEAIARAGA